MLYRSIRETLKHVVICFVAVITVILILMPLYFTALINAREVSLNDKRMLAEKGFLQLISSIDAANRLMYNLRGNQYITKLAFAQDGDLSTYASLFRFSNSIWLEPMRDDIFVNIMVQFKKNEILLLKNKTYDNKRSAYKTMFYYQGMDYAQWQARIRKNQVFWPAQMVYIQDSGLMECITFNWRNQFSGNDSVHLSALISVEKLKQNIGFYEIEGAFMYLVRNGSELLMSEGLNDEPEPWIITQKVSRDNELITVEDQDMGLKLALGIPKARLAQEAEPVTKMLINYILWALIAGSAISLLYGYFYFKPLRSLMAYLDEREILAKKHNVFYQIQQAFHLYDETGKTLRDNYRKMQRQGRAVAFEHAVSGLPLEADEMAALRELPVLAGRYQVLTIIFFAHESERAASNAAATAATTRAIIEMRWPGCYVQKSTMNRLFVILPFEGASPLMMDEMSTRLVREIGSMLQLGLSLPHEGIEELSAACEESQQAALAAEMNGVANRFMAHAVKRHLGTTMFVQYKELLDHMRAGNSQRVAEIFALFRKSIIEDGMNYHQLSVLFANIRDALEAAMRYQGGDSQCKLPEIDQYAPGVAAFDEMAELALAACDAIVAKRSRYHSEQIERILCFIADHYRDSSLSLQQIAEHFSVTESYLSQYIKEHTGRNYTAHLEQARMEEAMRLLKETNLTIDEICGKVGFEHKNTFYKGFKRYYGEPPNQFRKSIE